MNLEIKQTILQKIKDYQRIIIFRHKRPDGDAVGSTMGLEGILKLSFPEKKIYLSNTDYAEYVGFLGEPRTRLDDALFEGALGIVLDTATKDRVSDQRFELCREVIKIDHHIPTVNYGDIQWIEEERSSTCEMVADFYNTFSDELKLDTRTATCIYTGMVTDSGRFRFRSVSGETMRLAGVILDKGVDTDVLYANLYMKNFEDFKFQSYIYKKMKISKSGVAYVYVDEKVRRRFGLSFENACACVSYMDSIKDSLIWLAFIKGEDGTIRVRLRSRFVTVSELAEKYGGGGHACAAGAAVKNAVEMKKLVAQADELLAKYKAENEGWL
jgi:phosphoesterase RecJ-like protein